MNEADLVAALTDANLLDVNGKPNPWLAVQSRCVRLMTVLATRLRLSPQSRISQKQAARVSSPSYYDQQRGEADDD